jgi:hypothetical protein
MGERHVAHAPVDSRFIANVSTAGFCLAAGGFGAGVDGCDDQLVEADGVGAEGGVEGVF